MLTEMHSRICSALPTVKKNNEAPLQSHVLLDPKCTQKCMVPCLADNCVAVSEVPGRLHLRSARCHQLSVPRVRRITFFETHALSVSGRLRPVSLEFICGIRLLTPNNLGGT